MCPACLAVAGLVATLLRPWQLRRRARKAAEASAWQAEDGFRA